MSPNLAVNIYSKMEDVRHCRFILSEASPNAQFRNKQPTPTPIEYLNPLPGSGYTTNESVICLILLN